MQYYATQYHTNGNLPLDRHFLHSCLFTVADALAATKGSAIVAGYGLRGTTAGILRVHTFKVDAALQMANPW